MDKKTERVARCIANGNYNHSLLVGKDYVLLDDDKAKERGRVRVIDESGESYLFPEEWFDQGLSMDNTQAQAVTFNFDGLTREQAVASVNFYYNSLDEPAKPTMIKCDPVEYRQGFIEVTTGIHPGCVNIEAWNTSSDLSQVSSVREYPGPEVRANVELELNRAQASALVGALQRFLEGK